MVNCLFSVQLWYSFLTWMIFVNVISESMETGIFQLTMWTFKTLTHRMFGQVTFEIAVYADSFAACFTFPGVLCGPPNDSPIKTYRHMSFHNSHT
ncbi:hypothetical protein DERF_012925 [Dermatophagoides farinae]|uniref:Uncharacterized protein n=1 Tax=Dermatophagoides farinae TaxID=6954 RepID=A0A922HV78_DERFA|nr:hypothetical protein DERF_012925 [Dermatophagoides farinae]